MRGKVLVVDDERAILDSLKGILEDEGYEVMTTLTGEEGLSLIESSDLDVVILDVWLPGEDGVSILKKIKNSFPDLPVVMISGHGTISTAVMAVKEGAFDFLEKPLSMERVLITVRNAIDQKKLVQENIRLKEEALGTERLIGTSKVIEELRERIDYAAPTDATVLITGENGAGKEVVARLIHNRSGRKGQFVAVNCASIPENLIESELFGHVKGAFTGAVREKRGKVELAHGGTLFLDEIGDMSPFMQAKLLRFLEERCFERVGGTKRIEVDVRIVAATNKDLVERIEKGEFREDLYYRLNVIPIHVPPLRERREDIPLLVSHFLERYVLTTGRGAKTISDEAMSILMDYDWPGNVRELKNIVERLFILCQGSVIGPDEVKACLSEGGGSIGGRADIPQTYREAMMWFEKKFLLDKLRENGMNISRTAQKIGLDRSSIHRKLKALGITDGTTNGGTKG